MPWACVAQSEVRRHQRQEGQPDSDSKCPHLGLLGLDIEHLLPHNDNTLPFIRGQQRNANSSPCFTVALTILNTDLLAANNLIMYFL